MTQELTMPMIGEDIREAKITKILVKEGDYLGTDQIFIEISTDKVDIELPSPISGTVIGIPVREGEVVAAGATMVRVDTQDSRDLANHKAKTTDLLAALKYLSTRDIHQLCSRQELGDLKFEEFKGFLEEAAEIARRFAGLSFENVDDALEDKLRATLFFMTDLIKNLQGFKPKELGAAKIKEHKRICDLLSKDSAYALQRFREVLIDFGRDIDFAEFDPTKAYVFISYAHSDAPSASRLVRSLSKARIPYFLDEQMSYGEHIPQRIHNEVTRASHMIVLISPASAKSAWVPYEMGYARANGLIIIPYLLHNEMQVPSFIVNEKRLTEVDEEPRLIRDLVRFTRKIKPPAGEPRFETWRISQAKERIGNAKEIWHQSVSSYPSIIDSAKELETFVRQGGQFRCILTDPKGTALRSGIIRNVGASTRFTYLASQFKATKDTLERIAARASGGGSVTFKTIDFLPDPILTIIDPSQDEGTVFVTLNGFGQNPVNRPSFQLRRGRDTAWFTFYRDSFQQLWDHPDSTEVELKAG